MNKLVIRPFKLSDIWQLEPERQDKLLIGHPVIMNGLYLNSKIGSAVTALAGDKIIACAGVSVIFDHRAEAWGLFSLQAKNLRRQIVIESRKKLDELTEKFELVRIEATARTDWPAARNFLEHLGFVVEGIKKKYEIDGSDAWFLARTK
jgi:RimJ/RimL family protein N-acetyltransferase